MPPSSRVANWISPSELDSASFSMPAQEPPTTKKANESKTKPERKQTNSDAPRTFDDFIREKNNEDSDNFASNDKSSSGNNTSKNNDAGGFDPSTLMNLLGAFGGGSSSAKTSNDPLSQIGPLLGLLNGDKPDLMSLLPLIMQLGNKKKDTENHKPDEHMSDEPRYKEATKNAPLPEKTINLEEYID